MDPRVVIIDSGGANINSVAFALQRLGMDPQFSGDWPVVSRADYVILPGVGAAAAAMKRLQQLRLPERIPRLTQPVLGICLGMQLLFEHSDEGNVACLGIIPGRVEAIPPRPDLSIPHMGWNKNVWAGDALSHPLARDVLSPFYGYFVHSYAAPVGEHTLATARHGIEFSSMVSWKNFHGIQFHPERSGRLGQQLLANFLGMERAGTDR
jgi:glutamine amidotransferase